MSNNLYSEKNCVTMLLVRLIQQQNTCFIKKKVRLNFNKQRWKKTKGFITLFRMYISSKYIRFKDDKLSSKSWRFITYYQTGTFWENLSLVGILGNNLLLQTFSKDSTWKKNNGFNNFKIKVRFKYDVSSFSHEIFIMKLHEKYFIAASLIVCGTSPS